MSDNPAREVAEHLGDMPIKQPIGIAALALQMALKYHDTNVVKDGALYQQYKLEGKNMQPLHLDMVFETAIQIEKHLLTSEKRVSNMVFDLLEHVISSAGENGADHD